MADCDRAIALGVQRAVVYYRRGFAHRKLGMLDRAIADCTSAIGVDADYWHSYCERAIAYGEQNEYEKALADETKTLSLVTAPRDKAFVLTNRSDSLLRLGRVADALADLDAAIRIDPAYAKGWEQRGVIYEHTSQPDLAARDYTEAIRLAPKSAGAYVGLGNAYGAKSLWHQAEESFTKAIDLDGNLVLARYNRAFARGQLGDWKGKVQDYTEAIRLSQQGHGELPFGPRVAFYNRGVGYMNMDAYKEAVADFDRAIEICPEDSQALAARAQCELELAKYPKAVEDASRPIQLSKAPYAYITRGQARAYMGEYDKAIPDMDQAVRLRPDDPYVYASRGFVLQRKGDYAAAKEDFQKAVELDPNDASSRRNLQDVERRLEPQ